MTHPTTARFCPADVGGATAADSARRREGEDMGGQRYQIVIPRWRPTLLNKLLGCHWGTRTRLKRHDAELLAAYARAAGVPRATGRRRVSLRVTLGPGQWAPDPDSLWKSCSTGWCAAGCS
jgi:hypothetical protein